MIASWIVRRKEPMSYRLFAVGLFAVLLPGARAQTTDPATRELIERLLNRIDGLEKRVVELEKGGGAARATVPPAPAQAPSLSPTEAMHLTHEQAPNPV